MFPTLDELEKKRLNLEEKLSDSTLIANQREYKKVAQEHAQVTKLASLCGVYQKVHDDLAENNEMLHDESLAFAYDMLYPESDHAAVVVGQFVDLALDAGAHFVAFQCCCQIRLVGGGSLGLAFLEWQGKPHTITEVVAAEIVSDFKQP